MKRYVVEDCYGYWEDMGSYKRTTDLKHCDKFRFWIVAFLMYFDQIIYGSKIVKVEVEQ